MNQPKPAVSGVYINLPVADLPRAIAFFTALGFTFNPEFTDATATCMILSDHAAAMLLTREKFAGFAPGAVADPDGPSEVLVCLGLDSRQRVEELVRLAVAHGGRTFRPAVDHGFMYEHAFRDLDGHVWELMHMDLDAFRQAAASAEAAP